MKTKTKIDLDVDKLVTEKTRTNEAHLDVQKQANKTKADFLATLSKKELAGFKVMEDCVRKLERADLPFLFFANPFGYNFKSNGRGFWRYQRFYPL